MIRLDAEKMSKSVGNVFGLAEAIDRHGPETLILYLTQGHWRQPLEYDDARLAEAGQFAERIRNAARNLGDGPAPEWSAALREQFLDALAQDFNTPPRAGRRRRVGAPRQRRAGRDGGGRRPARDARRARPGHARRSGADRGSPRRALALARAREQARATRDWAQADRLRDELQALGWEVRDGPEGAPLRR